MAKATVTHLHDSENYDGNPARNPIRAFMLATQGLSGCCFCGDEAFQRGRDVLAVLASTWDPKKEQPTLPLSVTDALDLLGYLRQTEVREGASIVWGGRAADDVTASYGGDPGFGVYLILYHFA